MCYFASLIFLGFSQLGAVQNLTIGSFELMTDLIYEEDFSSAPKKWKSEGRGSIWTEEGRLQMDATGVEMTAWCPFEMAGDLLITFQAFIMDPPDANNINFFFMATGADGADISKMDLSGAYKEYHDLPNYIMTFTSGYTRLRRNPGFNLVSENQQVKALSRIQYELAVLLQGDQIRCFINDIPVHSFRDESRHRKGRVGFRTWHTRLWWDNLKVYRVR